MQTPSGMLRGLVTAYVHARQAVIEAGFLREIQWQQSRTILTVTESEFLREFAWVVLAAGMKEAVIRGKFQQVSRAFLNFNSARAIVDSASRCRKDALSVFGHSGKINAIIDAASRLDADGYKHTVARLRAEDVEYLQTFNYMGPATSCHLAKNLGLDVVKADRHLLRITAAARYDCPGRMCRDIADFVGERVGVVDLVLWRFATLSRTYLQQFTQFLPSFVAA